MNNSNLINIAIHHIKEENNAHGIGELKRGLYRDLEGIHLDVNSVKTDVITVNTKTTELQDYMDIINGNVDSLPGVIEERSLLAEEVSNSYTDGKISTEEASRIANILASLNEAKGYTNTAIVGTQAYADAIKTEVIDYSDTLLYNLEQALGLLAWEDKVELARLGTTVIDGGYIKTELIKAHSIGADKINTNELVVGENIQLGPNAVITWEHLAPEIVEEFDIGKMVWLGEFEDFPTNPGINHGFYHSAEGRSYIWSGSEWYMIAQDGTSGPKGDKGDKGDDGDRGTDGSYYAPSYLYSTYIDNTEIRSPLITGNTGRFADSIYIGQNDGSNNKAGISALGTSDTSIRIWAGDTNKLTAPFRVTQGGSVYMTKANIETETVDNKYITMGGSRIDGGRMSYGASYTIGTASYTNANRSGIIQLRGYASETSSTQTKLTQLGNNTLTFTGSNFVIGTESESRPTIITRTALISHLTQSIPSTVALYVDGDISVSGNVGVSGSFTSSDGKTITVKNGIITKIA